jgi:tetratricopeptide (TPR) repeat protein
LFFERKDRHVIPRWRDFKTTLALGELKNSKARKAIMSVDREAIARRVGEFETNRDIWHAADLLSSAFVVGDLDAVDLAKKFILENPTRAPKALISLASGLSEGGIRSDLSPLEEDAQRRLIHEIRARLRSQPLNAILWVELSRLYTLRGNSKSALRCMTTAANLAPDNRFVVRSAARLFLHEHEASTALRVIRKAAGVKRDPWLLAAEIAIASASRSTSLFAKIGTNRNEDDNISPFARTELSSALGTLEMENGKERKARQLFRRSLEKPNENSLAQVEFANHRIGGLEIQEGSFAVPRTFEASANLSLTAGEWHNAIVQGVEWFHDQPFSKHPAVFTSYVSSLIGEYDRSISILTQSLNANHKDLTLINNLAFALASANKWQEAHERLKGIDIETISGVEAITLAATKGLVLFRAGFPDSGRLFYKLAMSRAVTQSDPRYRAMASLYLAREELLAYTEAAEAAVNQALNDASKVDDNQVALIADQVRNLQWSLKSKSSAVR